MIKDIQYFLENNKRGGEMDEKVKLTYDMMEAAIERDGEEMERLMETGATLDSLCSHRTFLYSASGAGRIKIVKFFCEQGANLDEQDRYGECALHAASGKGHLAVVKFLVECGASLDICNMYEETPLFLAVKEGYLGVVKFLIGMGADIEVKNREEETLLHVAARYGYLGIVKVLIERGVDIRLQDRKGMTPLHCATESNHTKVVKVLLACNEALEKERVHGVPSIENFCLNVSTRIVLGMGCN